MNIFKFGGASLKSSDRIEQVAHIIQSQAKRPLLVVVSAMGKTTDALERVVTAALNKTSAESEIQVLKTYHLQLVQELKLPKEIENEVSGHFTDLQQAMQQAGDRDLIYDRIVSFGEIISSKISASFLKHKGFSVQWVDARKFIQTDNSFREGKVNWDETKQRISQLKFGSNEVLITQGFIGSTPTGETTTLGREGSDFTAAIFASCLQAEGVTIWKDVPGVMSADPKRIANAIVFDELPYKEAAEMTYYGASVIHPKTIKPLANKKIPLYVKCFLDPQLPGTKIHECKVDRLPPLIVYKENQCLVSCKVTDYTFVDETQIGFIFQALTDLNLRVNVMQNSAISFSFCIDYREDKTLKLIEKLSRNFEVYYNASLTLITIKNYDAATSAHYRNMKGVLLEQSSRSTLQVLVKPVE
ncbi:MAG: aspartate kinase [Cyclobacteriaceae bacterium]|jgi:aspartate kinase|nr:aspartate kinase [Flammeovirgaceae bacterium]